MHPPPAKSSPDLIRRALRLSWFTVGYNLAEAVLSLLFGAAAGSIALVGFGLDSVVESLSASVMIWRLRHYGRGLEEPRQQRLEGRAYRVISATFLVLGTWVFIESMRRLLRHEVPEPSLPGIVIAVASLIVMPALAWRKRQTARLLPSPALMADAKETVFCAWLSVALLLGLAANRLFGLWQADPAAGLVIVFFLFKEGIQGLRATEEEE
jgi:divalent metal cation (Fe/Co/Zn/Cd) transporter